VINELITWLVLITLIKMEVSEMADKLKVTLVKSTIGAIPKHRATVAALGLKKLNKTVEKPDNAAVRGMLDQVRHLVKVEEI
jgi:large subunit ribosomal protein L30